MNRSRYRAHRPVAALLLDGLTIKVTTALPVGRRSRAACARVMRSERVEIAPSG